MGGKGGGRAGLLVPNPFSSSGGNGGIKVA